MTDVTRGSLAIVPKPGPNMYNPITVQDLAPGMAVCPSVNPSFAGQVARARANSDDNCFAVGLAAAEGVAGHSVHVQWDGVLSLTTAQWDHLTGEVGGLTCGVPYYLSAATAGSLTKTAPFGDNTFVIGIGVSISPTSMMIGVETSAINAAPSGVGLVSEFVQQSAQAPIAPGNAILYTTDTPLGVINTIPVTPLAFVGDTSTGTQFLLPIGTYLVDFENSADAAWSLAIGKSLTVNGPFTTDVHTIAGASTATTWIHGRAVVVAAAPTFIIITPVTGTHAIPTAGTAAGEFIARITILKIA